MPRAPQHNRGRCYRDPFDAQLAGTQRTSRYVAGNFRAAAARIRQASLQASEEQWARSK